MQNLRSLLDTAEENAAELRKRAAGRLQPTPPPQQLRFFVVDDEAATTPLRAIHAEWRSPRSAETGNPESWERSAEGCVATLLREIEDPLSIEDLPPAVGSSDYDPQASAMAPDSAIVRAATAAAERRRRWQQQQQQEGQRRTGSSQDAEAEEAARTRQAGGGGAILRTELLFFHEVPLEERQRATDDLAALMAQALPSNLVHGPLLLCGKLPPPAGAASRGFACIPLGADATTLVASLEAVHSQVEARRARGEEMLRTSRQLSAALGCEQVRWSGELGVDEVADMCRLLLPQAPRLRAALDTAWRGIFVDLEPEAKKGDDEEEAVEEEAKPGNPEAGAASVAIVDASCGGGALHLRGRAGAAAAVDFVVARRGWRALRLVQERHLLCEELRERLGCRGVEASGAPAATQAQCDSLRRLVKLLRTQPVLLDGRRGSKRGVDMSQSALAEVTLSIGGGADGGAAGEARAAGGEDPYLDPVGLFEPMLIRLPDTFEADRALEVLQARTFASVQRTPVARKKGRRRGG